MTFPYQLEDPTGPMRTCEQYWQNAADAVLSGSPVGRFDIHIHNIYTVNCIYVLLAYRSLVLKGLHGWQPFHGLILLRVSALITCTLGVLE